MEAGIALCVLYPVLLTNYSCPSDVPQYSLLMCLFLCNGQAVLR